MNVTSLRSTMQSRRTSVRWLFFQHALNCCTQGSVSRPCRAHLSSSGVSLKVIFNILFSSRRVDSWVFAIARTIVSVCTSFLFRLPIVALVVLFLEHAFRLQPVVQVAAMNSATLDVNLKCSLTDLCQRWPVSAAFLWDV